MRPIVSISSNMCNRWCLKAKIVLIPNSGYNPPVGGRDLIGCGMPAADVRWLRSVTATTDTALRWAAVVVVVVVVVIVVVLVGLGLTAFLGAGCDCCGGGGGLCVCVCMFVWWGGVIVVVCCLSVLPLLLWWKWR